MPALNNRKKETFAVALVFGDKAGIHSLAAAYRAGFGNVKGASQSACRLIRDPEIAERLKELQAELAAGFKLAGYARKEARQTLYNLMIDKILATIAERSQDPSMAGVPGAAHGLLVKKSRTILARADLNQKAIVEAQLDDQAEDEAEDAAEEPAETRTLAYSPFQILEEVKADTALTDQLLKYLHQAAADERDFKTHSDITTDGQPINLTDDERLARLTAIFERARQAGSGPPADPTG